MTVAVAVPVPVAVIDAVMDAVTVRVGVSDDVSVAVAVPVLVAVFVAVPVPVAVLVAVPVPVGVSELVSVAVGVNVPVAVFVAVPVPVPVPVGVFVAVPVPVGVSDDVSVAVGVPVPVCVPVPVPVLDAVMEAVGDADGAMEADDDTEAVAVADAEVALFWLGDGDGEGGTYASFMVRAPVEESASELVICTKLPWFGPAPPLPQFTPDALRVRYDCTRLNPVTRPNWYANLDTVSSACRGVSNDKKYTTSGGNTHPALVMSIVNVSKVDDIVPPNGSVTLAPICAFVLMPHSGAWPR